MTSRYLIRLDDACPTMDNVRWSRLEGIFDELGIQPLVAVVPDNHDPVLQVDMPDPAFWDRVRSWVSKGWTIAMHGNQHVFHAVDRRRLILPFYDRSEFAGLLLDEQSEKIRSAWSLFEAQGINPSVWIAPAHCFDRVTLAALHTQTPIRIISDGIARNTFFENNFFWLPQQLWSLAPRRSGLWTICLHPNSMSLADINNLGKELSSPYYRERIVSVKDVRFTRRRRSVFDHIYALVFWNRMRILNVLLALRQAILAKKFKRSV